MRTWLLSLLLLWVGLPALAAESVIEPMDAPTDFRRQDSIRPAVSMILAANDARLCGSEPCSKPNICLGCGGRFFCVERGTRCCFGKPCGPGNRCVGCGGEYTCAGKGAFCCFDKICGSGKTCLGCGGRFHCVEKGSICCFGEICPPESRCLAGGCR